MHDTLSMSMSALVLLTAPECHLCEHGRGILSELGLKWREIDSNTREGMRLAAMAPLMRPVLFAADGRILAYGRLSRGRFRAC